MYPFFRLRRLATLAAALLLPLSAAANPLQWRAIVPFVAGGGEIFGGIMFDAAQGTYSNSSLEAAFYPQMSIVFPDADYVAGSSLFADFANGDAFLHLSFSSPLFDAPNVVSIPLAPDSYLISGTQRFSLRGEITAQIPEPETYAMMLLGLGALVGKRAQVRRTGRAL